MNLDASKHCFIATLLWYFELGYLIKTVTILAVIVPQKGHKSFSLPPGGVREVLHSSLSGLNIIYFYSMVYALSVFQIANICTKRLIYIIFFKNNILCIHIEKYVEMYVYCWCTQNSPKIKIGTMDMQHQSWTPYWELGGSYITHFSLRTWWLNVAASYRCTGQIAAVSSVCWFRNHLVTLAC